MKSRLAFQHGIPSICLTKLFTFSRLISNGIGASRNRNWCLFKIVLFNIVFFNVASTKSSNIAGILSFGGLLGLIRKPLVGFRLDFLAGFLQVSLAGFLQVWLTFLPSSCLCSRVFLWVPQQFLMLSVLPKVSSLSFRIR